MSSCVWFLGIMGELRSPPETPCMSADLIGVRGACGQDDAGWCGPHAAMTASNAQ